MATSTINGQIQLRRDTASNWTTENPVLLAGELGFETDTRKGKVGDGITTWNNLPYAFQDVGLHEDDLLPLATKTYTGLYANPNTLAGGSFYFAKVIPNDYYKPWKVAYRIHAFVTGYSNYNGVYTVDMCGCQSSFICCRSENNFFSTSYRPIYYHHLYRATSAGATTYGHLLGERIYSATNGNVAAYARTFEVEILSQENCTVTLFDTAVKYADAPGTGATNYAGATEFNACDVGTKITGDANTYNLTLLSNYNAIAGTNGIKQYALIMQDGDGNWQGFCNEAGVGTTKTKNTVGFRLGRVYYNYSSTNFASGERSSGIYEHYTKDLRYDCNCGTTTFTEYKPIYVKGSLHSDGLFYLADDWITQTLPTTEDGYLYIDIGRTYNKYCVSLGITKPIFYYKDGAIREYAYTASSGSVAWTDVTGKPSFATVATSGSYNDLSNKPTIPTVPTNVSSFTNDAGYITGVSWGEVTSKPTFATVATSGSYNDLSNKPTIPSYSAFVKSGSTAAMGLVPKPSTTAGTTKFLCEDATWKVPSPGSVAWADISNKPTFATVATSGSYTDLSNKPTIPTVPTAMSASEASTGTATTARTITAKVLNDLIDARVTAGIASIVDGDGVSY